MKMALFIKVNGRMVGSMVRGCTYFQMVGQPPVITLRTEELENK